MPEEARKEIAAGTDEIFYPRGFDPFNYLVQQLNNMDARWETRDNKYENRFTRIETEMGTLRQAIGILREEMHREFRSVQRWSFGTIAAVIVGFVGVIASLLAILARLP
ncbi:hypothetical protein MGLY_34370 [Neomoorella glycerini]|uniref:DUF1640 domain-containing protein n=1 Tax=Neomoorella glycerini TaxID=55779 RepID=A0A6I5ZV91_9FIRM|nr:hypothetical protein [Moorella glycerini]QGP94012.1 hypothetical protein MGLY_34370 [Moorella glycerini]